MRHVCDRDNESPTVAGAFGVHRIIEVARVGTVDRDQRQVTQVLAVALVGGSHTVAEFPRLRDDLRRKLAWDLELLDRNVRDHARIVRIAEHLDDLALRLAAFRRVFGDLELDEFTGLGPAPVMIGHEKMVRRPPRFDDIADAVLASIMADGCLLAALEDLDDAAGRLAAR